MNTQRSAIFSGVFWAILLLAVGALQAKVTAEAALLPAPQSDQELRAEGVRGLTLLLDGDPAAAIGIFRQIQAQDPQSPLGYLLEADAIWWKIYYETANLVDPDVFDVVSSLVTQYDSHLNDLLNTSIGKAQARITTREDLARSYFYLGMAHAIQARLVGLREELADRRSRHNSLREIERNYEGYGRGVRAVMTRARDAGEQGVLGLVSDLVRAPPEYERAITCALVFR